jgi:dihydroneopterin aldolase
VSKAIPKYHVLKLKDLTLWIHLGCLSGEQEIPQEVRVNLEFRFLQLPSGAVSDKLEETICYGNIATLVQEHCEKKSYYLIERLGFEIYEICKQAISIKADLSVSVHKVNAPVKQLLGGALYQCGDFISV